MKLMHLPPCALMAIEGIGIGVGFGIGIRNRRNPKASVPCCRGLPPGKKHPVKRLYMGPREPTANPLALFGVDLKFLV